MYELSEIKMQKLWKLIRFWFECWGEKIYSLNLDGISSFQSLNLAEFHRLVFSSDLKFSSKILFEFWAKSLRSTQQSGMSLAIFNKCHSKSHDEEISQIHFKFTLEIHFLAGFNLKMPLSPKNGWFLPFSAQPRIYLPVHLKLNSEQYPIFASRNDLLSVVCRILKF